MSTRFENEFVHVVTLSVCDHTDVVAVLSKREAAEYLVALLKTVGSGYEFYSFRLDDLRRVQAGIDSAKAVRDAVNRFDAVREGIGVPDGEERKGE